MAKDKKSNILSDLVDGYNKMYADPLEYAKTTYANQIKSQGRPYGGNRDARTNAVKPWDKNDIPV